MASWTKWLKLVDKTRTYHLDIRDDGPACYELGLGGPRTASPKIVYVGHTGNFKQRMGVHAIKSNDNLRKPIDSAVRTKTVYVRAMLFNTVRQAEQREESLLDRYDYDWNINLNL